MGFGADIRWAQMARAGRLRLGIVDAVRMRHLGAVGAEYDLDSARNVSTKAVAEAPPGSWEGIRDYAETWRPWRSRPGWL
jgi:hypothetical protein